MESCPQNEECEEAGVGPVEPGMSRQVLGAGWAEAALRMGSGGQAERGCTRQLRVQIGHPGVMYTPRCVW